MIARSETLHETRAADYIEFALKNSEAAEHLFDTAERQINALAQFFYSET